MAAFPTISNPAPGKFSQQVHKAQTRIPFESGVVQSAVKHTSPRYIFSLGWNALPIDDWNSVETHFDKNQGSTFSYTHPTTSVVYTVRYQGDSLPQANYINATYVQVDGLVLEGTATTIPSSSPSGSPSSSPSASPSGA